MSGRRALAVLAVLVIVFGLTTLYFAGLLGPTGQKRNIPPSAVVDFSPAAPAARMRVDFDGSRSTDADGRILSFSWTFGDGAGGSGEKATHAFADAGPYEVILTVEDDAGATGSDTVTVTVTSGEPQCSTPPSSPSGLRATATTATSIEIAWDPAAAGSGCALSSYDVYRDGEVASTTPSSTTTHSSTGLSPSTAYVYEVAARNQFGVSPRSSALTVTTEPATGCGAPPPAPTGLRSAGSSAKSVSLAWDPTPPGPGCTLLRYRVHLNGTAKWDVNGAQTGHIAAGLASNTSYRFAVTAVNQRGESPKSGELSVTTQPSAGWPRRVFAPYIDMLLWPTPSLNGTAKQTSQLHYTLAFVIDGGKCEAKWGGVVPVDQGFMKQDIAELRALGGDAMVSFGGAAGIELAQNCADVLSLKEQYKKVVNEYGFKRVDFDIEGAAVADPVSIDRRNKALVMLENEISDLVVSYTLPVMPDGLSYHGVDLMKNVVQNGVRVDIVNVMAMDYGSSADPNRMGRNAMDAVVNTTKQLKTLYPSKSDAELLRMMGVTPMIGVNDVPPEVFTLADARLLLDFSTKNDLGLLSMWSSTRDHPCPNGGLSPRCSGIAQQEFEFTSIFRNFTSSGGGGGGGGGGSGKRIVGYFIAWGLYQRAYHAKNVDTSGSAAILTHINYAFGNVKGSRCEVGDPWADYQRSYSSADSVNGSTDAYNQPLRGNFNQLKQLKAKHPQLRLIISLGGWTWSGGFSEAAKPQNRADFVKSCIDLFIKGDLPKSGDAGGPGSAAGLFDGIDIDWEYPAACGLQCGPPEDTPNFTGLLEELRKQLDAYRPGLLLTIAAPGGEDKYSKIELARAHPYLDFINLMNYDYHGAWEQATNFHSPLYGSSSDPSQGVVKTYFTDHTVRAYLNASVPSAKLLLGLGFYGRGWANVPNANDGLYQSSSTPAPGTYEQGIEDYKVLVTREPQFTKHRHPEARAHWIFDGSTFWSYDDPAAIGEKMAYAKSRSLGGAMFWELSGDTPDAKLLHAVKDGLGVRGGSRAPPIPESADLSSRAPVTGHAGFLIASAVREES